MVEKIAESKEKIKKSKEEQLHTAEEIPVIKPPAPDTDSNKSSTADFSIVGIGASAGCVRKFLFSYFRRHQSWRGLCRYSASGS